MLGAANSAYFFTRLSNTKGSEQEFMPLQQFYDQNMAFAIEHHKTLEDGVPDDTEPRQTRLRKQRYASYVEWYGEMKQLTIPKIDAFLKGRWRRFHRAFRVARFATHLNKKEVYLHNGGRVVCFISRQHLSQIICAHGRTISPRRDI